MMNTSEMLRKRAWVNGFLILLNVLYFLYLEMAGSSEDAWFMVRHGAMYGSLLTKEKEYYRLLTSMFMHFGIHHMVNNMLVLFILGDNLERALGHWKYLLFYLICGVGANLASLMAGLNAPAQAVGAGASGAIFGVIGGLFYAVVINRGRLEDLSTRQLAVTILFSLYFGFTSTGVDNVAHVSGLLIGIVMAALMYRRPVKQKREEYWEI